MQNDTIIQFIEQLNNFSSCVCSGKLPSTETDIAVWCNILIPFISILVLIIGWFINTRLRQKEERLKEQLHYRMNSINVCIDFLFLVEDNKVPANELDYKSKMINAKRNLFYFGTSQENELLSLLIKYLDDNYDRSAVEEIAEKLQKVLRDSVKQSLKLS